METIHTDASPLAAYLEGEGTFEETDNDNDIDSSRDASDPRTPDPNADTDVDADVHQLKGESSTFAPSFASRAHVARHPRVKIPPPLQPSTTTYNATTTVAAHEPPKSAITRAHHAWSSAVNSRLGAGDNTRFLEHFRYTIVASQLLNEYLDHGSLQPSSALPTTLGLDGASDDIEKPLDGANLLGALSAAALAFALVYLIEYIRTRRVNKSKAALVLAALGIAAFVGYGYLRRQWLQGLRRQAVDSVTGLTTNWQALELSCSSALSFIQEVELVSKGYRLSTPLPPASRIEDNGTSRRCAKLRNALHKSYSTSIPACIDACTTLRSLIDEEDLDKYFEVYDISAQDAREAAGPDALAVLEQDPESLKSLRILSYRFNILRRVTLCYLMALEADGGKADFRRWQQATEVMSSLSKRVAGSAERIRRVLSEMENINLPSPARITHTPTKEKVRNQARKIAALGTGIRGLQAKMQILREETNRSIEQSDDLSDLGPTLMAQYEAIGADLKELLQAWEAGKQSLQSNINRHERRISLASSGLRSPVSSLGGLTAVEEVEGCPADALKVLNGDSSGSRSNRSSLNNASDEEMVFEAVALPRQRANTGLTREQRITKMHEEREKQMQQRAQRDANTSMLKELESVINLRPKKVLQPNGSTRITSV